MAPRSNVELLPTAVKQELDRRLQETAYGSLVAHSEWLATQGFVVSKSALNRYAKPIKERISVAAHVIGPRRMVSHPDNAEIVNLLIELGALRVRETEILAKLDGVVVNGATSHLMAGR